MKKIIALLMAMVLVLGLTACGNNAAAPEAPKADAPAADAPAADAPAAGDFKVGAIYINSKNDTAGYTFAHHNGITTAMNELGQIGRAHV